MLFYVFLTKWEIKSIRRGEAQRRMNQNKTNVVTEHVKIGGFCTMERARGTIVYKT